MKVLLSDGSGLTARQTATRLALAGHVVEVLSPDPLCLCRFTRHVCRVRAVPSYGVDPLIWLDAALAAYAEGGFDLLVPTQEQVAVLAAAPSRLASAGVTTAVPDFKALCAVQDKVSASTTLTRLGIPQPRSSVGSESWDSFPAFVKAPIGTASGGVIRVDSIAALRAATSAGGPVLVHAAVDGPLAMCQCVFDRGSLVAFHACSRTKEGPSGGASHKLSIALPEAREWLEVLGSDIEWHGALSGDVIVSANGPLFIDINPRLVEPANAWLAGVDLVGALVDVATGGPARHATDGREGVATHQLLLAVLGAAQGRGARRQVAAELVHAARGRRPYEASSEELTPWRGDHFAALPVLAASLATLLHPPSWRHFTEGSVANYALTPTGWDLLLSAAASEGHSGTGRAPLK